MKKLLIITSLILFAGVIFSQTLQKGGSIGLHVTTITLAPDVTIDQYLDFLINKYVPEMEKHYKGLKINILKGDRGAHENKIAVMTYFESEKARDRYWPEEGKPSDEANTAREKIQPLTDELQKMGTQSDEYSGWVIQ
jgi:hypothetical protein